MHNALRRDSSKNPTAANCYAIFLISSATLLAQEIDDFAISLPHIRRLLIPILFNLLSISEFFHF